MCPFSDVKKNTKIKYIFFNVIIGESSSFSRINSIKAMMRPQNNYSTEGIVADQNWLGIQNRSNL